MCSATFDRNMPHTKACAGAGGSGSVGWRLLISWTIGFVEIGGAFLAATRARPFSPVRAHVATLRTRDKDKDKDKDKDLRQCGEQTQRTS